MIKENGKDEAGIGSAILYTPVREKRKKINKTWNLFAWES